jgi:hypothetical protein
MWVWLAMQNYSECPSVARYGRFDNLDPLI